MQNFNQKNTYNYRLFTYPKMALSSQHDVSQYTKAILKCAKGSTWYVQMSCHQIGVKPFLSIRLTKSNKVKYIPHSHQPLTHWSLEDLNKILDIHRWLSLELMDGKSTLFQVMSWQQAITWASIDPVVCHHVASLHHDEFNPSHANSIYKCALYLAITVPADGLAPNGARPSASTMMTTILDNICLQEMGRSTAP